MPIPPRRRRSRRASVFIVFPAVALLLAMMPAIGGGSVRAAPPPLDYENCVNYDVAGELPAGSLSISGTVRDTGGVGIAGVEIRIGTDGHVGGAGYTTRAGGAYAVNGLAAGSYVIAFYERAAAHQSGFRGASGLVLTPAEAQPVVLSGTTSAAGVDIVLPAERFHSISGAIKDRFAAGVDGVHVKAESPYFPEGVCGDSALPSGTYSLPAVRVGVYTIKVNDYPPE